MRRLFWLGMGAAIGVLVVRRISRTAESLSPAGIGRTVSDAVSDLADAVRAFGADVREGMQERETELRAGVGTDGKLGAMPQDFEHDPHAR